MENAAHSKTLRRVRIAGHIVTTAVECYVLLEILWYYTHSEDETLHDVLSEWWQDRRERARQRNRIRQTLDMIRDLPETDA